MFDKATLTFEIIRTVGLLYEVRHQGPNKLGNVMEQFNSLMGTFDQLEAFNELEAPASQLANEFLESAYHNAQLPAWVAAIDSK